MSTSLSKQKLDIAEMADRLKHQQQEIAQDIRILEAAIQAIDRGEDMINGRGLLPNEVRIIMNRERHSNT